MCCQIHIGSYYLVIIPLSKINSYDSIEMELASGTETKRDKQGTKNGQDFDILRKDEAFWQKTVKILAKNQISNEKVECEIENGSDVSK